MKLGICIDYKTNKKASHKAMPSEHIKPERKKSNRFLFFTS